MQFVVISHPMMSRPWMLESCPKWLVRCGQLLRYIMIYQHISIWVGVNTYRYIFSGMNIHLPAILGFTRYQGFDPSPYQTNSQSKMPWQSPSAPCCRGGRGSRGSSQDFEPDDEDAPNGHWDLMIRWRGTYENFKRQKWRGCGFLLQMCCLLADP